MTTGVPIKLALLGITGDLARGKIMPALYYLEREGKLTGGSRIIGTSRKDVAPQTIIGTLKKTLQDDRVSVDQTILDALGSKLSMLQLDPAQAADYQKLRDNLQDDTSVQWLVYLSLPPKIYRQVIQQLGEHGCNSGKLLVEKPFGYDSASARQLLVVSAEHFAETQTYRIDHYLEKPALDRLLAQLDDLPNGGFNGQSVTQLTVTAAESIGIADRAAFYDDVGAMRDLIQSHLLQVLASVLAGTTAGQARGEALQQLLPAEPSDATRGQYDGYRQDVCAADSTTETYASVVLNSKGEAWQDTRFQLITGKSLVRKYTGVDIYFADGSTFNYDFQSGTDRDTSYEQVLLDAVAGRRERFISDEQVMTAWNIVQPLLDAWQSNDEGLVNYAPGAGWPL